MKKILVLLITVIMVLGTATGVMAATINFESGVNGKVTTGPMQWDSTDVFLLDFKAPIKNWFIGLNCLFLNVKDSPYSQIWNYGVKGGYSFLNDDTVRVSATLGYDQNVCGGDILINAITVGLDGEYKITPKLVLGARLDCAVAAKNYRYYGLNGNLDSAIDYKVHLCYYFTDNFGVCLGYYYNDYKPEGEVATAHHALTLGVTGKL